MVSTSARPVSRPLNFWLCLGIPTVAAIILVLLELTDLDMDLARLFYDPVAGDFIGRHSFFLFFVLRDRRPRLARQAFIFAFALGSVFSISRMMQGAHFFSHNVWTAIFCWLICLGSYYWVLYRPAVKAEAVVEAQPVSA